MPNVPNPGFFKNLARASNPDGLKEVGILKRVFNTTNAAFGGQKRRFIEENLTKTEQKVLKRTTEAHDKLLSTKPTSNFRARIMKKDLDKRHLSERSAERISDPKKMDSYIKAVDTKYKNFYSTTPNKYLRKVVGDNKMQSYKQLEYQQSSAKKAVIGGSVGLALAARSAHKHFSKPKEDLNYGYQNMSDYSDYQNYQ